MSGTWRVVSGTPSGPVSGYGQRITPRHLLSKQIGVGAGTGKADFRRSCLVNQKPIQPNMAFAFGNPVSDKRMVAVLRGKGRSRLELAQNGGKSVYVIPTSLAEFQIMLELAG